MKKIKTYYKALFLLVFLVACTEDDLRELSYLDTIAVPTNLAVAFNITQDNTGLVTLSPTATSASNYEIYFGDGTSTPEELIQGESVDHMYIEGTYDVRLVAYNIKGETVEIIQQLVVSFLAPENLEITAQIDSSNPFVINVSATADFAASFLVFFDISNSDEVGTPLALDGTVSFEYPSVGDYTIRVEALSGGSETSELTEDITISSPVELPIDFEIFDSSVFQGFGGASNAVIDNPDTTGNDSATVGKIIKDAPEVWAGNVITLSAPIDFSAKKVIKMNVWSPRAGGKILLKVENLTDGGIFFEVEATTIGNSAWEEVSFDLSAIDVGNTYQKIVLFFDFGTVGDGSSDWTFYIDDIKQAFPSTGSFEKLIIENFEGATPTLLPFGNAAAEVVTLNDLPTGLGIVTANVAQFSKPTGAEVWAGVTQELSTPLDLDTYSNISLKTWSPKVGAVVKIKLENADASITHEIDISTTVADTWEELVYDFSGAPVADYVKIVVFFDFGVGGDDSVYYFDDYTLTD